MSDQTADQTAAHTAPVTSAKSARTDETIARQVTQKSGVSPWRQYAEIFLLKVGKSQLTASEYYDFQIYDPALTRAQKREFVGEKGSHSLNMRLGRTAMPDASVDKMCSTARVGSLGLMTARPQAGFATTGGFGPLPILRSAADVVRFLTTQARYPMFGKPLGDAHLPGPVLIRQLDGMIVTYGNGQSMSVSKLAEHVATNQTYGYVFQDAVTPHPQIATLTGSQTASTIRVVTVRQNAASQIVHAIWRLPAPAAMSDNFRQKGSLLALVNPASGLVIKVRYGFGPVTKWAKSHPVTGVPFQGFALPCWQSVMALATAAHASTPEMGIMGWDIAITARGAVLIDCDHNPNHALYQLASARGILNADFQHLFDTVNPPSTRIFPRLRNAWKKGQTKI